MLQSTKLNGTADLESILTSDMEIKNLEISQLVFGLALIHYFLTMLPFLCFGMIMYILCHYMLEVCDLLLGFEFTGGYI